MKTFTLVAALLLWALSAHGQMTAPLTPAEQKIALAQKAIEKNPEKHQAYNELAMALARRARETADPSYYARAEEALEKSFRLAPENFEGQKVRVWVLLGKHEFARALELATQLNRRVPDDLQVYGLLVDAHVELGNYNEAEAAAQWMLDLRPGNVPGLARAAYLRELFGDLDGAIELMNSAYQRTPPQESEDRAWFLTQIAHLSLLNGRLEVAEKVVEQALQLFPGYHYALANLAQVRTARGKHVEAVALLRQRYLAAPHPENLFDLGQALHRAGRRAEARGVFAEFEQKARAEMGGNDNANRELIFYYAEYARKPAEALRIARQEAARRRDVHTLDAYAWALSANGQHAEARKQIEVALAVGVRDPKILEHARVIAARWGAWTAVRSGQ